MKIEKAITLSQQTELKILKVNSKIECYKICGYLFSDEMKKAVGAATRNNRM